MFCPHRWFLASWRENERALSGRFDDWKVRCGHCGQLIAGCGDMRIAQEVVWRHEPSYWFGSFTVLTC